MTKHISIFEGVDVCAALDAVYDDAPVLDEDAASTEARMEAATAELQKKTVEPFDLFGDHSLTGKQELTRDMLPDVIYDYARDMAVRPGLNPEPIAVGCLVSAAAAIREGWRIQPKIHDTDWTEQPILWVGITGDTGAKKTHATNSAKAPLELIEKIWEEESEEARKEGYRLKAEHNEAMKVWRAERKAFEKQKVEVRRDSGTDAADDMRFDLPLPEKPVLPKSRRLVVKGGTSEGLMKVCADNPSGVIVVRDELTEWISSFDLYNGGSGSRDRARYLTSYNGGRETIDLASNEDGPLVVDNFAVCIFGGIQDDIIRKKFSKDSRDGFLARFLFTKAEKLVGRDQAPEKASVQGYFRVIDCLATREIDLLKGGTGLVRMSKEAAAIREEIELISHSLTDHPSIAPGLGDHLNKWPGIFSRLCLIFHMIEWTGKGHDPEFIAVREDTARRAYNLMTKYFLPEAARIYNEVMQGGDEQEQHARWIAGHILAHGKDRISTYDIRRAFSSIANDDWALKKATSTLEIMAWITPDTKKDGSPYSRADFAKMKWRVNPRVHELFADVAQQEERRRREVQDKIAAGAEAIRKLRG